MKKSGLEKNLKKTNEKIRVEMNLKKTNENIKVGKEIDEKTVKLLECSWHQGCGEGEVICKR